VERLATVLQRESPSPSTVALYFVVPPDKFKRFPLQSYTNTDKKTSKTAVRNVVQYALKIAIPLQGAKEGGGKAGDDHKVEKKVEGEDQAEGGDCDDDMKDE
jgi:hypothetical protein